LEQGAGKEGGICPGPGNEKKKKPTRPKKKRRGEPGKKKGRSRHGRGVGRRGGKRMLHSKTGERDGRKKRFSWKTTASSSKKGARIS